MSFIEVDGNRGLHWTAAGTDGRASIAVWGTKLPDMLQGSTVATAELVVVVEESINWDRLINVSVGNTAGSHFGLAVPPGASALSFHPYPWVSENAGEWSLALPELGRVVVHLVVDTDLPNEADRAQLFVDGAAATPAATPSTTYVPLQAGATVDLGANTFFDIGNKQAHSRSIRGTIFYAALYAAALTTTEIGTNVTVLQGSDDHP